MITKKAPYEPKNPYIFLDEKRRTIAQMRKKISKLGIDPNELGIFLNQVTNSPTKKGCLIINEIGNVGQS